MTEDEVHMGIGKNVKLRMADGSEQEVYLEPLDMEFACKYIPLTMKFAGADADKVQKVMENPEVVKVLSELIEATLIQAKVENPKKIGMLNFMNLMNVLFELNPLGIVQDKSALEERMKLVRQSPKSVSKEKAEERSGPKNSS